MNRSYLIKPFHSSMRLDRWLRNNIGKFPQSLIEKSLPFGSFLLFIILFTGLARNPKVPYFIRYNACQALLIDIALIIISYLLRIFPIVELGSIIFIFTLCIFIYSISQCIFGVEPEIPLISKSVRMQI